MNDYTREDLEKGFKLLGVTDRGQYSEEDKFKIAALGSSPYGAEHVAEADFRNGTVGANA